MLMTSCSSLVLLCWLLKGDESDIGRGAIRRLMDTVDAHIEAPERDTEKPFLMPVEDVFTITGRGTVVTGRIERGIVRTGDVIDIVGLAEKPTSTVTGIEMFRKILDEGFAGDNAGILLRGTKRDEVQRGQVLCKAGTVQAHTSSIVKLLFFPKKKVDVLKSSKLDIVLSSTSVQLT